MAHHSIARPTIDEAADQDVASTATRRITSRALHRLRIRWAAIGAAIAVTLGAGGLGLVSAGVSSGERLTYVSIAPCRLVDLRPQFAVGPRTSPLGPEETFTIAAHGSNGNCAGIPNDAVALTTNVTALNATAPTFLTIWPANASRPAASSLNPVPGQPPTPNAVMTRLSPTGQFSVFNRAGSVDMFVDVTGYYVDHDHDDRYDTSAEVDAKITNAIDTSLSNPDVGPETIDISTYEMSPDDGATGWNVIFGFWFHQTAATECLNFPVRLVPGQAADSIGFAVRNEDSSTSQATMGLYGLDTRPATGNIFGRGYTVLFEDVSIPNSGTDVIEVLADSRFDPEILPGHAFIGRICTNDEISVYGAQVRLTNP